jgi:hypothetical protein
LQLQLLVFRRHPERSEGPPYWPLSLFLPLLFFLSFPLGICFFVCLCSCLFSGLAGGFSPLKRRRKSNAL